MVEGKFNLYFFLGQAGSHAVLQDHMCGWNLVTAILSFSLLYLELYVQTFSSSGALEMTDTHQLYIVNGY